jgi:hypothetical protein
MFCLTTGRKASIKNACYTHGPHVWRRPFLKAFVDSAMGLCVQGGAPLIGGRGMLADAICLWIAVVLSVFGAVLLTTVTEPDSDSGVSHTDRESSVVNMTPRGRWAEHQSRSQVPPSRNGRRFVQSASPEGSFQYSSARAAGLHGSGHARFPRCQQPLSLTYLSLSGARPPLRVAGGLCTTPPQRGQEEHC